LTLLEAVLALAIFLFSLAAIGRLVTIGSDRARDIQGREGQLCQSKLAEVVAGVLSVQGGTQEGEFDEAPGWHWTVECQANGTVPGLYNVKVTVTNSHSDGSKAEAVLTQMVLDPSLRGSLLDPDPIVAANTQNPDDANGPSSSDSSSQGSSSGTPTGGGAAKPPTTGGKPATGGATPPATGGRGGTAPASPAKGTGTPKGG
jgi:hypothetical protein